ncbi:MAG: dTDP-4-dehydrorhamnose reductase [Colwellia sp.]|jgi:dTDP-4-dehydrorhamnose reductase
MKIAVIGHSGQLAWEIQQLQDAELAVFCLGRNDVDLSFPVELAEQIKVLAPDAVINASAYTAVDTAESDQENAFKLNCEYVGNLASVCKKLGIPFIHVSTDFVFHGDKGSPYLPDDTINPLGVYGASKAAGEKLIFELYPQMSCVLRTSWVYSTHGNNFVKTMMKLMSSKPELGIISDQIGSPTYAKGLAVACVEAAKQNVTGIHHYTDNGVASWYDFAVAIQEIALSLGMLEKEIPINAITTADYPTPAKRPHYSVLDKSSFVNALPSCELVHWRKQLEHMMQTLGTKN